MLCLFCEFSITDVLAKKNVMLTFIFAVKRLMSPWKPKKKKKQTANTVHWPCDKVRLRVYMFTWSYVKKTNSETGVSHTSVNNADK